MNDRKLFEELLNAFRKGKEKEFLLQKARWAALQRRLALQKDIHTYKKTQEKTLFDLQNCSKF